jgi:UDP-glucose 4-epimerase
VKKILVTGGLGYIGSHTVVELYGYGYEPVIVDDLSNSELFILDRIKEITGFKPVFYPINLLDEKAVTQIFAEHHFDGIIHFAAFKAVGESVENPIDYYKNNLGSLLNIIEQMNQFSVDNLIFSSSCTVYGQAEKMPIDEKSVLKKATSPYGKTKLMCEEILQDFVEAHKKKSIALRYFNPIGAHTSAKIGELPIGVPNNLVPFITQTAAGIRKELSVFGNDYPTKDGTALRDYIFVVDLAKAHILAMNRLIENKNKNNFEVFNLGTGKGSTVLEVIQDFEKSTGIKLNYKITDPRKGDVAMAYANADLAKQELGWEAKTSLQVALKTAWEWQKKLI